MAMHSSSWFNLKIEPIEIVVNKILLYVNVNLLFTFRSFEIAFNKCHVKYLKLCYMVVTSTPEIWCQFPVFGVMLYILTPP